MAITKILIVEDEEILANNLRLHLQRCGWDVCLAHSGRAAIAAADEFCPEVVLLDYHLSDMTGFDVLDAIRAADHCCGCVLMTGHPPETVMADAQRRRIAPILSKPFSLAGLVDQLTAAVKLCAASIEARATGLPRQPCRAPQCGGSPPAVAAFSM